MPLLVPFDHRLNGWGTAGASYTGLGSISTNLPTGSFLDAANTYTLGVEFYVTSQAWLTGIRFYRPDTNIIGTPIGRVWTVNTSTTGTAVAGTDVTFTLSGTGWQEAGLAAYVPLTVNQRYRAGVAFGPGHYYPFTGAFYTTGGPGASGLTSGPLVLPNQTNATGGMQGQYAFTAGNTQTLTFPSGASNDNYWIDVTVATSLPSTPPPLSASSNKGAFFF